MSVSKKGKGTITKYFNFSQGFFSTITQYIQALRLKEVSLMVGFFVIGSFFAMPDLQATSCLRFLLYALGSFLFVTSVYAFNAYGGYPKDKGNQRLSKLQNLSAQKFLSITLGTAFGFLFCFYSISPKIALLSILSYLFWMAYSYPQKGLKNYPIAGTIIHFITQVLHFQMGYLVFLPLDTVSYSVSIYFALLFSAAHFHHEVIDYQVDKQKNTKTSAVFFGQQPIEWVSLLMFSFAFIYWYILFHKALLIEPIFYCFAVAYCLQLITKISLTFINLAAKHLWYRKLYRLYYFFAGIVSTFYLLSNGYN